MALVRRLVAYVLLAAGCAYGLWLTLDTRAVVREINRTVVKREEITKLKGRAGPGFFDYCRIHGAERPCRQARRTGPRRPPRAAWHARRAGSRRRHRQHRSTGPPWFGSSCPANHPGPRRTPAYSAARSCAKRHEAGQEVPPAQPALLIALGLVLFYAAFTWAVVAVLLSFTRHPHEIGPPSPAVLPGEITLPTDFVGMY